MLEICAFAASEKLTLPCASRAAKTATSEASHEGSGGRRRQNSGRQSALDSGERHLCSRLCGAERLRITRTSQTTECLLLGTEGELCSAKQPVLLRATLALNVSPALTQYPKCQPLAKKLGYFPEENFEPIFIPRRRRLKPISHQHLKAFNILSPE